MLTYNFWQRRFHGDPEIAGKTIKLEGHDFTIVGVAPKGFIGTVLFNFIPNVWVPGSREGWWPARDSHWRRVR